VADAVDEMLVKISSLVGGNPNWHTGEPLTISFKKVSAAETVRALWDKVSTTSIWSYANSSLGHGQHNVNMIMSCANSPLGQGQHNITMVMPNANSPP